MQTSLVFLGALSTILIMGSVFSDPIKTPRKPAISKQIKFADQSTVWNLSIPGSNKKCAIFLTAPTQKTTKASNSVLRSATFQNGKDCIKLVNGLGQLANVRTDDNGDITLLRADGAKLAQFMESESSEHESFWPSHPLMSLSLAQ